MSKASFWDHPLEKLEEALHIKRQIHALEQKLSSLFGGEDAPAAEAVTKGKVGRPRGGRRKFSAESRAKMAAAQKARWAKANGSTSPATVKPKKKGRRTMSPEARERIAAAQRARWAKAKRG